MTRRGWWRTALISGGTSLAVTWVLALGTVLERHRDAATPTDWSDFDVLANPTPDAPPPTYPKGTISRTEHRKWIAWGEKWFREMTFGNEIFWTDIMGVFNGSVQVPDGRGGLRDEPYARFLLEALDGLDGVRGNLFSGNGGIDGSGYTSDLVIDFPPGTLLDGIIPVPRKLHTGLDVEAGSPLPIGVVAIPVDESESHLPYLLDASRFASGPRGIGPGPATKLRVGMTCALCHFSLDVDWDGQADLKSTRPDRPTRGSPYQPRHTWALGNQDLSLAWFGALAENSVAGFSALGPVSQPAVHPRNRFSGKDARVWGEWLKSRVALDPARAELEVDRGAFMSPRGYADDTPDAIHNPLQFPALFTYRNWPYNYDGVMLNASDRNNNVWTNGLDPTGFVALCRDRGGRATSLLVTQEPGVFSVLSAQEYADILLTNSPIARFDAAAKNDLIRDIMGTSDGVPGIIRADAAWVLPGVPAAVPDEILNHPDNLDLNRLLDPADLGADAGNRGAMMGLLGTRVTTPPEIRRALKLDEMEARYGLPAEEFLTEAVSTMLDWSTSPPNLTPLMANSRHLVQEGYRVFRENACASCHAGPFFTNNSIVPLDEIGTNDLRAKATGPLRSLVAPDYDLSTGEALPGGVADILGRLYGNRSPGYKVVTLRYVWGSAPYLHDGGVAVALRPEARGAGHELQPLLRRDAEELVYGVAQILNLREANPAGVLRPNAPLSLQALLLETERARVVAANRDPVHPVPAEDRAVSVAALNIEGIGHEYWVDDVPGGDEITALIAFLLALDDDPSR